MANTPALPRFTMSFEPTTIDHLGLRLYSTLPPVIGELVSNAYDAESASVEIAIPEGPITTTAEVVARDYGHGMTAEELQNEYLPIGRNRRGNDSSVTLSKNGKVKVTGRKGLGKLSAFGISTEMDVRTIKDGSAVALRFNYNEMRQWRDTHGNKPYEPKVLANRTGATDDPSGTEIRLRGFHRKNPFSPELVRRGLARRAQFVGSAFQVYVNGIPIGPGDRVRKDNCELSWTLNDTPIPTHAGQNLRLDGWIGFVSEAAQTERGIDIFAHSKAVELGSFFNFSSTHAQFARAHVVGEVHANFLDEKEDLAATARNSVVWESPEGEALQQWGQALLKWAFDQWLKSRQEKKEEAITTVGNFDQWMATRDKREQRIAKKLVNALVADDRIEAGSTPPLLEIIKASVETLAFHELVELLDTDHIGVDTLLQLFDEWRVIEAREHLRLSDGRKLVLDELKGYMDEGALEVQQMQPLFEKNPWLLDPAWTEVNGQSTYTKLLRQHCKEPNDLDEVDRRMDILGITASGMLAVVELKRPEKTLSRGDLEQIESYVDWARTNILSSGPHAPKHAAGLLVVGRLNSNAQIREKVRRLEGDGIRVETYGDIYGRGVEYYGQVDKVLRKLAPEYKVRSSKTAQS